METKFLKEHTDLGANKYKYGNFQHDRYHIQILSNKAKHFTKVVTSSGHNPDSYDTIMIGWLSTQENILYHDAYSIPRV